MVSCLRLHANEFAFEFILSVYLILIYYSQLHLAIINEIPMNMIWQIIRLAPAPWLLDLKNDDAQAPVHLAVLTRQPNVVRRLLIAGAKVCNIYFHDDSISNELILEFRHSYTVISVRARDLLFSTR